MRLLQPTQPGTGDHAHHIVPGLQLPDTPPHNIFLPLRLGRITLQPTVDTADIIVDQSGERAARHDYKPSKFILDFF